MDSIPNNTDKKEDNFTNDMDDNENIDMKSNLDEKMNNNMVNDKVDCNNRSNINSIDENEKNEVFLINENNEQINNENKDYNRSCLDRYFGKMEEGSLRSSIFILINLGLGISVFSLASTFEILGIVPSSIITILISYLVYIILKQLGRISEMEGIYDFSLLIKSKFGEKFQICYDILIMINLFGLLLSTQVITNRLAGYIVYDIGFINKYKTADDFIFNKNGWYSISYRFITNFIISTVFFLPLCIPRDLSKIAWTSVITTLSLIYTILVSFYY